MDSTDLHVARPQTPADYDWLSNLWREEWGGETMVSKGETYHIDDLPSVIAWHDGTRIGAATYRLADDGCELVSINAVADIRGTGSALLQAVEAIAADAGCSRIWLITTNDNLTALRFYQRRGYCLCALYPGAVDAARKVKPTIPLYSDDGIPIHDELEFEKSLHTAHSVD